MPLGIQHHFMIRKMEASECVIVCDAITLVTATLCPHDKPLFSIWGNLCLFFTVTIESGFLRYICPYFVAITKYMRLGKFINERAFLDHNSGVFRACTGFCSALVNVPFGYITTKQMAS